MKLVRYRTGEQRARLGELVDGTVAELRATSVLEWVSGDGREQTGAGHDLAQVELLAPFDRVPSFRDFSAFEGHTRNVLRTLAVLFPDRPVPDFPPYWFEAPGFYFSNPAAFRGPGAAVAVPPGCEWLDFELEIAALVGPNGEIAAFTLLNDWSARDVQLREMSLNLGPHKGKDFCTSVGPWLVTPDELPYVDGRLDLVASVSVNGEVLSTCSAVDQHFSWPQLLEHAARGTALHPGDLIGSGTLAGGCLLELGGLPDGRWLRPGDDVELACDQLGTLRSRIVE